MKWDRETSKVTVWKQAIGQADRCRMRIVIPSMGRADTMRTLNVWPQEWAPFTYLAVPLAEAAAYKERFKGIKQIQIEPQMASGIAATRQYIWDQAYDVDFVCQVSDDLRFAKRDGDMKLHRATEADMLHIFDTLYRLMANGWLHAGLSARGGNNHVPQDIKAVSRMCDVYAHNHRACKMLGVRWDRVPVMEDFDVTLQLLRLGHPNAVIYDHCWDQNSSNAGGGCSTYRTPDVQEQGAHGLARLHPGYVTVVQRKSNNWQGFPDTRADVRVAWRKALDSWGLKPGKPVEAPAQVRGPCADKKRIVGKKRVVKRKVAKRRVVRRKI